MDGWNGYFVDDVKSEIFTECITPRLIYNVYHVIRIPDDRSVNKIMDDREEEIGMTSQERGQLLAINPALQAVKVHSNPRLSRGVSFGRN